ncbi:MAG: hypothetical protein KC464_34250 [Myxococcales bacterium]|nr:hypothetical protein [Myxococcales bacterium]
MNTTEMAKGMQATLAALDRTLAQPHSRDERARLEARRRDIERKLAELRRERAA